MTLKDTIILFDLDGTLIDSTPAILYGFEQTFKHFNKKMILDNENIISLIGYPLDIMFEKLGVSKDKIYEFVTIYKTYYAKVAREKTTLLENAKEAIIEAYGFSRIGIVTTKTGSRSKDLLEYFDVLKYFDVIVGRENVINPKPHPEPILNALKQFDTKNKNIWMIGDTILDLKAALAAKINMVGVLSGYGKVHDLNKFTGNIKQDSLEAVNFIRDKNN